MSGQAAVSEPQEAAVLEPSRLVGQILQQHLTYLLDQCSCAHCGRIYTHGLLRHEQTCQHRHTDRAPQAVRLDLEAEAEGETEAEAEGETEAEAEGETEAEVGVEAETESTAESAGSEFQSLPPGAPCATSGAELEVSSRQAQAAVQEQPDPRSPARTTQRGVPPGGADASGAQSGSPSADEAHEALYCVCRKPYNPSFFYIGCEECQGWFHGKCVGVAAKQASSIKHFVCAACTAATGKATTYHGVHPPCRRKPLAPGLRMEVACCPAYHEGVWEGKWEECEVVADHGDTCDVRIVEDGQLCRAVPRRLIRAAAAAAARTVAALAVVEPEPEPECLPEPEFLPQQYRLLGRGAVRCEAQPHPQPPPQKRRRKGGKLVKAAIDTWVQCDKCEKWRRNPNRGGGVPEKWWCELNKDKRHAACTVPQESWDKTEVARGGGASSGGGGSGGSGGSGDGSGGGKKRKAAEDDRGGSDQGRIRHLGKFLESCGGTRAMTDGWHTRTEVRREG